ncbi:MAG: Hsp70 family protein, partial [Sphaerochaetaceae bacterium]
EIHAEEDRLERQRIEARNEADNLIYSTEKSLKEHGDKISQQEKANIDSALEDLKGVLSNNNVEEIKAKTEALQQAAYKLAEEMYKAGAAQQEATDAPSEQNSSQSSDSGDDGVEDADFEVVD